MDVMPFALVICGVCWLLPLLAWGHWGILATIAVTLVQIAILVLVSIYFGAAIEALDEIGDEGRARQLFLDLPILCSLGAYAITAFHAILRGALLLLRRNSRA